MQHGRGGDPRGASAVFPPPEQTEGASGHQIKARRPGQCDPGKNTVCMLAVPAESPRNRGVGNVDAPQGSGQVTGSDCLLRTEMVKRGEQCRACVPCQEAVPPLGGLGRSEAPTGRLWREGGGS